MSRHGQWESAGRRRRSRRWARQAPDVLETMFGLGALENRQYELLPGEPQPDDRAFVSICARRPVFESALRRAVEAEQTSRYGAPPASRDSWRRALHRTAPFALSVLGPTTDESSRRISWSTRSGERPGFCLGLPPSVGGRHGSDEANAVSSTTAGTSASGVARRDAGTPVAPPWPSRRLSRSREGPHGPGRDPTTPQIAIFSGRRSAPRCALHCTNRRFRTLTRRRQSRVADSTSFRRTCEQTSTPNPLASRLE
jgi:hypothetical protein